MSSSGPNGWQSSSSTAREVSARGELLLCLSSGSPPRSGTPPLAGPLQPPPTPPPAPASASGSAAAEGDFPGCFAMALLPAGTLAGCCSRPGESEPRTIGRRSTPWPGRDGLSELTRGLWRRAGLTERLLELERVSGAGLKCSPMMAEKDSSESSSTDRSLPVGDSGRMATRSWAESSRLMAPDLIFLRAWGSRACCPQLPA
mmetsp:Transcript_12648/g.35566  ORF Transcript_12648/g.35566 Transcript_12648/m.35566 type:complete len:202 (-) Transcript_12648:1849-2454(-)